MLITQNVFKSSLVNSLPHKTMTIFDPLEKILSHLKTLREKQKMVVAGIFSFPIMFIYPIKEEVYHLSQIEIFVSRCSDFGLGQNFVVQ